MATYTWGFGAEGSGLYLSVVYNTETKEFTVTSEEGSFDLNALWFSNGDTTVDGDTKLVKADNSLNMNGSNTVWDNDGNATTEKIVWDDYAKLSNSGLGAEGEDKASFFSQGESQTFSLAALGLPDDFDPEGMTLGVRATSVNGDESIKFVDKEAEVGEEANYFTFNFVEEPLNILADPDDYDDNTGEAGFNGAAGDDGEAVGDTTVNNIGNYNDNTVNADAGNNGTAGGEGMDAYNITNISPYDGIKIISGGTGPNYILGGAGGDGGAGSDGGSISVTTDDGNDTGGEPNLNGNTLSAGDGGNGGAGGSGGHAIINGDLSEVIIEGDQNLVILGGDGGVGGAGGAGGDVAIDSDGNANDNTLTAGDGGAGGAGGAGGDGSEGGTGGEGGDVSVTADGNSNVNIITNGANGAEGASTGIVAAFSAPVNVDASAFTGHLTISGSDGADTMEMGSSGSHIYDTLGVDTYTLGAGVDTVQFFLADLADVDTVSNFTDGVGGDVLDISDLLDGSGVNEGTIGSFVNLVESGGNTTVQVDLNGGADSFQDVVTLEGVTGLNLGNLLTNGNLDIEP